MLDRGIRRTTAFYKIGRRSIDLEPLDSLNLQSEVTFHVFPEPFPADQWPATVAEYDCWLLGQCLRELDQFFSVFLDQVWNILEIASHNGATLPANSPLPIDRTFHQRTSVASKLRDVVERIGFELDGGPFLSLTKLRNCLSHHFGHVAYMHRTDEKGLLLQWRAPTVLLIDGHNEVRLSEIRENGYQVESEDGAQVVLKFEEKAKLFAIGEKIVLSEQELAEIASFYQQTGLLVVGKLIEHLRSLGIENAPDVTAATQ